MAIKRSFVVAVLALLLGGLSSACGGGGGGDSSSSSFSASLFTGLYGMAELGASVDSPQHSTEFGSVVGDGMGMAVPTVGDNDGTTYNAPAAGATVAYGVGADGVFTVPDEAGHITNDGRAALTMGTMAGSTPGFRCFLRPSGTYSNATLTGNYHVGILASESSAALWTTTATGYYQADGAGMITIPASVVTNTAGVHSASGGGFMRPYSVAANGVLDVDTTGSGQATGGLAEDGSFACTSGRSDALGPRYMSVMVKVAAGATNATLSGTYIIAGITSDPDDGNRWSSFLGKLTADGAGNLSIAAGTDNREGSITASTPQALTYSVSADGSLTVEKFLGAVTADGQYAYLCGETDDSDAMTTERPGLIVLIRQ